MPTFAASCRTLFFLLGALASLGCKRSEAPAGTPPAPAAAAPAGGAPAPAPTVYDPTKLLENGVAAGEVFNEEPRTATWADPVEGIIGGAMGRDLAAMVPGAAVVLKCKTLSCLVGIDAPEDKRADAVAVTKFLMLAPWVVDLPAEDDGTVRWLFFQEPRFADVQTFLGWYTAQRKRKLADIRSGKAANPFPVAATEAPRE